MSRFADSPYFLLKDFMLILSAPPDYIQSDIVNLHTRTIFSDIIWVGGNTNMETSSNFVDTLSRYPSFDSDTDQANIFTSDDVVWNSWVDKSPIINYYIDKTEPKAGILRGGDVYGSIVVDGGAYIDVYVKLDDVGFVPVRLKPIYEDPVDKKYFRFDLVDVSTISNGTVVVYDSDDIGDEPYYDSDFVSIQTLDYEYDKSPVKWGDLDIDDILSNGVEIYFRKDSSFHDWLKIFAENYYESQYEIDFVVRNYVNTDKRFLYFGELFQTIKDNISDPNRYHIIFNGLKDWVKAALPQNNRTDNLVEFFDTYFDQVYSEGYQLLKDVWSLRDGRECDPKFLGYIPTFYGMTKNDTIPDWFIPAYREYADELIYIMKRKGTYAAMYVIYSVLCGNSLNIFNILERWHDDQTGVVTEYQDHIYTSLYGKQSPDGSSGAGSFWYEKQDYKKFPEGYLASDDKFLSPYYRVDIDLCNEPFTNFEILPKDLSVALYNNLELQRPINRQAEYNLVYAPITDLTGNEYNLYDKPYASQSITSSLDNVTFDSDNHIYIQRENSDVWGVSHPLNTTDLIIACYDSDFEKQIPRFIQVVDESNILIRFDSGTSGILMISKASTHNNYVNPTTIRVHHGLNRKEILWQIRNDDGIVYYPEYGEHINNNTTYVSGVESSSSVYIKTGIALDDLYDSDDDGDDDTPYIDDVWVFDDVGKVTSNYEYGGEDWIVWIIDHPLYKNMFQVNCYNEQNLTVEPAHVLLNELDCGGLPMVVILWKPSASGDVADYLGFAAINPVGDVVSFYGIVPQDTSGELLRVDWRLTIETDDSIYTFLTEGSSDAVKLFAGKDDKNIYYYDPLIPENKTFVYGTTDLEEYDDDMYYYTFTVKHEALEQLGIRDYKIISAELINNNIKRINKKRIVYSRMSGIYKPNGMNFVCHFRILKSFIGEEILLDVDGMPLLDTNNYILLEA